MLRYVTLAVSLALAGAPSTGPSDAARARQAFAEGRSAMQRGETSAAIAPFEQAVAAAPTWALAQLELGIARSTLSPEDPLALAAFERAVALEPQNPRAHLYLGVAYERVGRREDAARELRAAIARRADLTDAHYALGRILAETGPAAEAIAELRLVQRADPNNSGALSLLAELYEAEAEVQEAESALLAIVRLFPAIPYHRYRLGQFYERVGMPLKAKQVFTQLEELEPPKRKMRQLR